MCEVSFISATELSHNTNTTSPSYEEEKKEENASSSLGNAAISPYELLLAKQFVLLEVKLKKKVLENVISYYKKLEETRLKASCCCRYDYPEKKRARSVLKKVEKLKLTDDVESHESAILADVMSLLEEREFEDKIKYPDSDYKSKDCIEEYRSENLAFIAKKFENSIQLVETYVAGSIDMEKFKICIKKSMCIDFNQAMNSSDSCCHVNR